MRWLYIAFVIAGFALVFSTHSALLLAIGLVLGVVGAIGCIVQVLDARLGNSARADAALLADTEVAQLRAASLRARDAKLKVAQLKAKLAAQQRQDPPVRPDH